MTHVPAESTAWHRAGADAHPSASGEQFGRRGDRGSDLPAAGQDAQHRGQHDTQRDASLEGQPTPPFPEARQHEGGWSAQHARGHHDDAYREWREAHARQLDQDYEHFRRERFRSEFEAWRNGRQSPRRGGADAGEQRSDAQYDAQRPGAFGALSPALPGGGSAGHGDLGGRDGTTGSDPYGA